MAVRNLLFCLVRHRAFSDRASGHFLPLQYHSLGGVPPYCQFIFKTLTGSARLHRLGANVRPPPKPRLSCRESLPLAFVQIGMCWLSCLGQGVTGMGLDWPAAPGKPNPPGREISGCAPTCSRGYCWILPFPMSVPAQMHSKDI